MAELLQATNPSLIIWGIGLVLSGSVLGGIFYGGLWWTVRKSMVSINPAFWVLSSLLVRMGISLGGFYFVISSELGGAPWQRLLLCLFGFLMARLLVTRFTRVAKTATANSSPCKTIGLSASVNKEAQHGP